MNTHSRALWDFLQMAHERGLNDEFIRLFGSKMFNPSRDLVDNLGEFEDMVLEQDLGKINALLEQWMVPVLNSLTNEETIDSMKFFLVKFGPGIKNVIGDDQDLAESAKNIARLMTLAKKMILLFGPIAVSVATPYIIDKLKNNGEKYGAQAGKVLSGIAAASNEFDKADPNFISDFARGFKKELDSPEIKTATDRITGMILDQKIHPGRLAFKIISAKIKRRFGGRGRD